MIRSLFIIGLFSILMSTQVFAETEYEKCKKEGIFKCVNLTQEQSEGKAPLEFKGYLKVKTRTTGSGDFQGYISIATARFFDNNGKALNGSEYESPRFDVVKWTGMDKFIENLKSWKKYLSNPNNGVFWVKIKGYLGFPNGRHWGFHIENMLDICASPESSNGPFHYPDTKICKE